MEKRLFTILTNNSVAVGVNRIELEACESGYEPSGEFVDVAIEGLYLRRPMSICDGGPGRLVFFYKVVGEGTKRLAEMAPGATLDILTGLGNGFNPDECRSEALLIGGGLGAAPLYRICKELKARGKKVTAVLGFNKADEIILEKEFREAADSLVIATADGSVGVKGFVTDAVREAAPQYDYYYTCGPNVMMKALFGQLSGSGEYSLGDRMGCGAGYCYGCSLETASGPKRICKDGPVFKKEELLW